MKKFLIFFIIYFCTSFCYASNISEKNNLNIIINSEKINFSSPPIIYNNYTLVPLRNMLNYFEYINNINYYNKTISFSRSNSNLILNINSTTGYIDNQKIELDAPPILYKNLTYVPLKTISQFLDCYIYYDDFSKTIFIKDLNEYQQIESFFEKLNKNLSSTNSLKIDIINEFFNKTSSFSYGNSIYIDNLSKKILTKNILDENWKESNTKISFKNNIFFNSNFFVGITFDRINSDKNKMIFYGYYPSNNGVLCKTKLYVDPTYLIITKQEVEFLYENLLTKQTIFYEYNKKKEATLEVTS